MNQRRTSIFEAAVVSSCPFAMSTTSSDQPPPRFGPYELLERQATDGPYEVWRARDERSDQLVWLRRTGGDETSDERLSVEAIRWLNEEADRLVRCAHLGIVSLHERGELEGRTFLATTFVDGPTLRARLAEGPLLGRDAAELTYRLADAVRHCHESGVRGTCPPPAHVVLEEDLRPRLLRLGFVDGRSSRPRASGRDESADESEFQAPEQRAGKVREGDESTDVYALGALLRAMLTAPVPPTSDLAARTPAEAATEEAQEDATRPAHDHGLSSVGSPIPHDLEQIYEVCLRADPTWRYDKVDDLAKDLRRYLAGQPIAGRPITTTERMLLRTGRHPLAAVLMVLCVLLSVAAAGFLRRGAYELPPRGPANSGSLGADDGTSGTGSSPPPPAGSDAALVPLVPSEQTLRELAAWRAYVAEARRIEPAWREGNLALARQRLESLAPKSANDVDLRGVEWRYWVERLKRDGRSYEGVTGRSVAVSPDGGLLAVTDESHVRLIDAATGQEKQRLLIGPEVPPSGSSSAPDPSDHHARADRSVAFSHDGRWVAATTFRFDGERRLGALKVWDVTTGEPRVTVAEDPRIGGRAVVFAPDDRVVIAGGYGRSWMAWNVMTGEPESPATKEPDVAQPVGPLPPDVQAGMRGAGEWILWDMSFQNRTLMPLGVSWPTVTDDARPVRGMAPPGGGRRGPNVPGATAYGFDGRGEMFALELTPEGVLHLYQAPQPPSVATTVRRLSNGHFTCVAIHERSIAAAGADQIVRVWNLNRLDDEPLTLRGGEELRGLTFRDDGQALAAVGRSVRTWNLQDAGELQFPDEPPRAAPVVVLASPARTFRSERSENRVRVVRQANDETITEFPFDQFLGMRFSPSERFFAVSLVHGRRFSTSLWDLRERREIARLPAFGPFADAVAFSPDETLIAGSGSVWKTSTGEALFVSGSPSDCTAFGAQGELVAFGDSNRTVVHHARDRQTRVSIPRGAQALAFTDSDTRIVIANLGEVSVWDLVRGVEVPSNFERETPTSIRESRDGRRLYLFQPGRFSVYAAPDYVRVLIAECRMPNRTNDLERLFEELPTSD